MIEDDSLSVVTPANMTSPGNQVSHLPTKSIVERVRAQLRAGEESLLEQRANLQSDLDTLKASMSKKEKMLRELSRCQQNTVPQMEETRKPNTRSAPGLPAEFTDGQPSMSLSRRGNVDPAFVTGSNISSSLEFHLGIKSIFDDAIAALKAEDSILVSRLNVMRQLMDDNERFAAGIKNVMVDPGSQELTGIHEQIIQISREIGFLNQCRSEIADWTQCYSFIGRAAVLIATQPKAFKDRLMAAVQAVQSGQDGESHVKV